MLLRSNRRVDLVSGIALAWCLLAVTTAPAGPGDVVPEQPAPAASLALSLEQLACMNWGDLEQLYRQAGPGPIPTGYLRGRTIYCPDARFSSSQSKISKALWHGKHFCPEATLVNQWCLGIRAVRARICLGESWLDGQPSILMDYRGMSHVIWKDVRDEIREIAPGLYLGIMYRCKTGQPRMKMFFALELESCDP
ncbi:MAG TPA: hypothetical protein VN688_13705 [Gemmataceae bacterium]|nr:hypothetical protein [Gemmataceae bacterium]